ncbi:MAG: TfoX/Sxy family DNA transformation protein [Pirellulaceae bacterium]
MAKKKKPDTRKISEMRNLGPACERDLNAVGIVTAQDLLDVGIEMAFIKLLQGRVARGLSTFGCNAAYLYAMYGAVHDIDWRKIPAAKKIEFKKWTAELRESGEFSRKARPKKC